MIQTNPSGNADELPKQHLTELMISGSTSVPTARSPDMPACKIILLAAARGLYPFVDNESGTQLYSNARLLWHATLGLG